MRDSLTGKIAGVAGSASGAASILGSWQICHNICLGLIALLGVMGITLTGMPLAFFIKIAVPLWIVAVILFIVVVFLYVKKKCISKNLIILNVGLIIAGTPFQMIQPIQIVFWMVGGALALLGIGLYVRDKVSKRSCKRCKK